MFANTHVIRNRFRLDCMGTWTELIGVLCCLDKR